MSANLEQGKKRIQLAFFPQQSHMDDGSILERRESTETLLGPFSG